MKYTFDNFIKQYDYNLRRKNKILKVDRLPVHKRMKHILTYILYFLRYTYDNEIHLKYHTFQYRMIDKEPDRIDDDLTMYNISFYTDQYFCIMEIGRCTDGIGSVTLRLYKHDRGLETLATESITLERDLIEAYADYLESAATILAKKLLSDEVVAYCIVQGINLREIILWTK